MDNIQLATWIIAIFTAIMAMANVISAFASIQKM
jgi:hypothetical protein